MFKSKKMIVAGVVFSILSISIAAEEVGAIVKKRENISSEYKWNLMDVYKTQDSWQDDFYKVKNEYITEIKEYRGKLKDLDKLAECLKASDKLSRTMSKVYTFAALKSDENKADSVATENLAKAETLNSEASEAAAYIEPEILEFEDGTFRRAMKSEQLKDYRHYLDKLKKRRKHTLSRFEEEILAKTSDIASNPNEIYNKIVLADMKYPDIKDEKGNTIRLTNGNYQELIKNQNRDVRKAAFEGVYTSYDKMKNSLAATLAGEVKTNIFYAKTRKYKSALEASLEAENIPTKVYESLIRAVENNLESLHKYVKLRKEVLKLDKVHLYDMYVDLIPSESNRISYVEGQKIILESLKPLGENYISNLKTAFSSNWIDVYETENKYSGAYNWGTYDTHPYILMNYSDNIDGLLTTVHELGHAMNSVYTNKNQPYANSNTPIFTAEVASTTNELILMDYMIRKAANDKEKLYLINKLVEEIRGTVYSQVMYAEFERYIHERVESGEALSPDILKKSWGELMKKYYGNEFEVDELATMWWSRIPHFYMNFYVYKYSTGIAAAYPLSKGILAENPTAVKKYIEFLGSGDSDYPIETLKRAGVDMTTDKPVSEVLVLFNTLISQMEELLKKQGKI